MTNSIASHWMNLAAELQLLLLDRMSVCRAVQTLILRDWWLCMVISVMFEVVEYTLEHQLPNFSECWWDHVGISSRFSASLHLRSL